jgi:hypothetical protein
MLLLLLLLLLLLVVQHTYMLLLLLLLLLQGGTGGRCKLCFWRRRLGLLLRTRLCHLIRSLCRRHGRACQIWAKAVVGVARLMCSRVVSNGSP